MISIFDDEGNRLSISYNGVEFNQPVLGRMKDPTGLRVDYIGFSTPTNFHSETISDIVKNGGGTELYNPLVNTRVMTLRGSIRADVESNLNAQIRTLQRALSPLLLQSTMSFQRQWMQDLTSAGMDINLTGTRVWPPAAGLPSWVRALPLKFTRVLPKGETGFYAPTFVSSYEDGKYLLQYNVVPLGLADPIKASVTQGVGVDFVVEFLLMDGGRSFDQSHTDMSGDGPIPITWGRAPMWPIISFKMTGAGATNFTYTTTITHMATALVLDLSGLSNDDKVEIDSRDRTIWVNNVKDMSLYVSGDYPILGDYTSGLTTATWTNLTNISDITKVTTWRESDYY